MQCSNSGCTERLTKVDIKVHESFECYWRIINCEHCQESFVFHEKRVCRHSYKQMNFQWNLLRPNYIAKLSPQQRVLSISVSPKAVILLVLAFNLCNSYIYTLHCLLLWERLRKKNVPATLFPLRRSETTHVKKYNIFFTCVGFRQSTADASLAFRATRSGWWVNGKAFTILNPRSFNEIIAH